MYLVKTPKLMTSLFPNFSWNFNRDDKVLYLTFDDGPIPNVTPWVLEQLKKYDAKATFFCVGENVYKHPDIYDMILEGEHTVGSHTYNHLNGWQSDNITYFHNVRKAAKIVGTNIFRPPYGRLSPQQASFLQRHYEIIMWDVLSGDFDPYIAPSKCVQNVLQNVQNGSIVVFHDSLKAEKNLKYALPIVLETLTDKGFRFEPIQQMQKSKRSQPALEYAM